MGIFGALRGQEHVALVSSMSLPKAHSEHWRVARREKFLAGGGPRRPHGQLRSRGMFLIAHRGILAAGEGPTGCSAAAQGGWMGGLLANVEVSGQASTRAGGD